MRSFPTTGHRSRQVVAEHNNSREPSRSRTAGDGCMRPPAETVSGKAQQRIEGVRASGQPRPIVQSTSVFWRFFPPSSTSSLSSPTWWSWSLSRKLRPFPLVLLVVFAIGDALIDRPVHPQRSAECSLPVGERPRRGASARPAPLMMLLPMSSSSFKRAGSLPGLLHVRWIKINEDLP